MGEAKLVVSQFTAASKRGQSQARLSYAERKQTRESFSHAEDCQSKPYRSKKNDLQCYNNVNDLRGVKKLPALPRGGEERNTPGNQPVTRVTI